MTSTISTTIAPHLKRAVQQCSIRGLFLAANWAAEQLSGCCGSSSSSNNETTSSSTTLVEDTQSENETSSLVSLYDMTDLVPAQEIHLILLGTTLLQLGEYQRCGYLFINHEKNEFKAKSSLAIFLYAYSQYLAGEKQSARSQKESTSPKTTTTATNATNMTSNSQPEDSGTKKFKSNLIIPPTIRNSSLPSLVDLLTPYYYYDHDHATTATTAAASHVKKASGKKKGRDSFLLYLLAVVTTKYYQQYGRPLEDELDPWEIYKLSVALNPYNWSAWMDLASYCLDNHRPIPSFAELHALAREEGEGLEGEDGEGLKVMHAFFITHVFLEKHRGDLALQVLKGYYSQRLYDRAQECFDYVRSHDPCRLEHIDTYSNILYVKERTAELSLLAHEVVKIEKYSPEVCCVVGNYYSLKGQHEKAVLYFTRALSLHPDYLSAWTLMGHEYIELHNITQAIQCYRQAISIYRHDYRPWYGLGQTYEILHLYQYAIYYFNQAAALRPFDARMWSAVGNCLLKLGMKLNAIEVLERAVRSGDREGIATRDLARLYRDEGEEDRAADLYYRYLTCNLFLDPILQLPSPVEGGDRLPISLTELVSSLHSSNGFELISAVGQQLDNGLSLDSEQAEALLYLVLYFQAKNDTILTEFFCSRLLGFHGPEGDEARLVMKGLRSEVVASHSLAQPSPSPLPTNTSFGVSFASTVDDDSKQQRQQPSVDRFMLSPSPSSSPSTSVILAVAPASSTSILGAGSSTVRRQSTGSAMSLASGIRSTPFDPFERLQHHTPEVVDIDAELDLTAISAVERGRESVMESDLSGLADWHQHNLSEQEISGIQPSQSTNNEGAEGTRRGGFPRRRLL
eukprot:scaffold453_cov187-Ochromonas_danica.AAC.10